jgi:hypothetical protein
MKTLQDLEVLERYLSEEELKGVAKDVARELFRSSLGEKNPHRKANLDYYIGQGALQAVEEYMVDFDKEELASDLKARTKALIKTFSVYNLPDTYIQIAKEEIENSKQLIKDKINKYVDDFVNGTEYPNSYGKFSEILGEQLGDVVYNILGKEFKKE